MEIAICMCVVWLVGLYIFCSLKQRAEHGIKCDMSRVQNVWFVVQTVNTSCDRVMQ